MKPLSEKINLIARLLIAVALFSGCGTTSVSSGNKECAPGKHRCGGTFNYQAEICNDSGKWTLQEDCQLIGKTCLEGFCVPWGTDGDFSEVSDNSELTDDTDLIAELEEETLETGEETPNEELEPDTDGDLDALELVDVNEIEDELPEELDKEEAAKCKPSAYRCSSDFANQLEKCNDQGEWIFYRDCNADGLICQNDDCIVRPIEWVTIPDGTFWMGCNQGETNCQTWETPRHQVTIKKFRIMKYEVTQGQFEAVMGNNPSYFKIADKIAPSNK